MSGPRIVLCNWHPFSAWRLPESVAEAVRDAWPEADVVHLETLEGHEDALSQCRIFAGSRLPRDAFARAPRLTWIHSTATSVAQFMYPELVASAVVMTNARTVHAAPMAEHAMAMILAMTRRLPSAVRHQSSRHWAQQDLWDEQPRPGEIAGSRVLLVGFGAVGRAIAARLGAFGATVHAVTRTGRGAPGVQAVLWPADRLRAVLPAADVVVLAAPATKATARLVGREELAAMRPGAILVNLSRGSLVDEEALVDALVARTIGGAALDVFEEEPLPPESPLWTLPNVLVTPHTSAVSDRLWPRQTELLVENLRRFREGRPLLNIVDKNEGY
ncbi:MAG: D-2-hydroxyacid dehydrogenase [Acidobacteriota bacterium]